MKKIIFFLVLILLTWIPSLVFADNPQILSGFNWLISAKNGHEYWGCKIPTGEEIDELTR